MELGQPPTIEVVIGLAEIFAVSIDYLLVGNKKTDDDI